MNKIRQYLQRQTTKILRKDCENWAKVNEEMEETNVSDNNHMVQIYTRHQPVANICHCATETESPSMTNTKGPTIGLNISRNSSPGFAVTAKPTSTPMNLQELSLDTPTELEVESNFG